MINKNKTRTVLLRMIENLVLQSINRDELHFHIVPGILRDNTLDDKFINIPINV